MSGTRLTTAGRVLRLLIGSVGIERVAESLVVPTATLQSFVDRECAMDLHQQRSLAIATLVLGNDLSTLRRAGSVLLAQVQAAESFHAGSTVRHSSARPTTWY